MHKGATKRDAVYLNKQVLTNYNRLISLTERVNKVWKGREVLIECPEYTGQKDGKSRRKLFGEVLKVQEAKIVSGKVLLYFSGHTGGIDNELVSFYTGEENGKD